MYTLELDAHGSSDHEVRMIYQEYYFIGRIFSLQAVMETWTFKFLYNIGAILLEYLNEFLAVLIEP